MRPIAWLDAAALDSLPPALFRWIPVGRARGLIMHGGRAPLPLLASVSVGPTHMAIVFVDPDRVDPRALVDRRDLPERLTIIARQLGALRSLPSDQQRTIATDLLVAFQARSAGRAPIRPRGPAVPGSAHPSPTLLGYGFLQHLARGITTSGPMLAPNGPSPGISAPAAAPLRTGRAPSAAR